MNQKKLFSSLILALLFLGIGVILWGLIEPYTIDETHHTAAVPGLGEDWEGSRIAVISDLQVGMWWDNTRTIRWIVSRITDEQPEAVIILGDFIYHGGTDPSGRINQAARLLKPLEEAGLPVFAVLGNHDYSVASYQTPKILEDRARQLSDKLQAVGIQLVQNQAAHLESPSGQTLFFLGTGSHMAHKADPGKALQDVPEEAARVVIMHNPETFSDFPASTAPLALAGHTHGGQFRLPFLPEWTWMNYFKEEETHADGWIQDYGAPGNRLYVNRGIGFSLLPLRLNCPPELSWFTLMTAPEPQ
jgi:hypothetical protein